MKGIIYIGHIGIGDPVKGEALVAKDNFSARYDLDRINGKFSRPSHKLFGQYYNGKVLVLNAAKGGVATAWMLRAMSHSGVSPLALVLNYANPIIAQGAAHANFPLIDRFEHDITEVISTGDIVTVDPLQGTVTVHTYHLS